MPKTHKKREYNKKRRYAKKNKTKAGKVPESTRAALIASIETMTEQNNMALMRQLLDGICPNLIIKVREYEDFINSVVTSYEYRHKNIPSVLVTLITQIRTVIERANHIIRFRNEPEFLQEELATNGYDIIVAFIQLTIGNIEDLEDRMRDYTQNALDDYEGTQLEIETQPAIRNRTTRRTVAHSISNFARALAARARTLTRRTRIHII